MKIKINNKINTDNPFQFVILKWNYILIILAVAILIGYVFAYALKLDFSFVNVFFRSIVSTSLIWGGCMAIVTIMWKKFPWEKMPLKHLFYEILFISLYLSVYIIGGAFFISCFESKSYDDLIFSHSTEIIITILISFLITTIHEAVFFYQQWKYNFSKSVRLEKDNIEAQYAALKAQVNPHFLFNSLNSLITMLDEHPLAEKYVQDLSDYLRYVLVSNTRETVTLQEELENSEKYIHLQKQRFGDNFDVEFNIEPADLQKQLPPLAMQMLLENCFNHNVVSKSKPLHIKVFSSENSLTIENNLQKKHNPDSTGQGLKNIEGRYRFAGVDAVKIELDEQRFAVTIPLIMLN